ncbi:kinase-like domain-containing protein [Gigaspora rosea]|uniref:Kinase-like domain-containing protein n=1 Tax=Gigaspora rosea TaxID=44941 RepID=A0A397UND6_9GLOM|nr:kinase-like domain-containing protein [Gigaspora rosea]
MSNMCKRKNYTAWCQECATSYFKKNFTKWTSGNRKIDETQTNSKILEDFIEWIPYEQLEDIKKVSYGGFGTIYSAYWTQGPLYMDLIGFKRVGRIHVALKSGISSEHLEELQMHIKCCTKLNSYSYNAHGKNGSSPIIRCYGLTKCHKSKNDKEYMLVIQFAENSDLRKYLSKNFYQMRWLEDKMSILANIANGLKIIHNEGLTHLDLHCGNILIDNDRSCVSDFGLSRPFDHKDSTTCKQIFGVVPFIAPEIFENKLFSPKSDVYSFGIIMWIFTSGILPFHNRKYNEELATEIYYGARPQIIHGTPPCFVDLMQRCWDPKPEKRPTSSEIYDTICSWYYLKNYKEFRAFDKILLSQNKQDIENQVVQSTPNSSRRNNSYHSCIIDNSYHSCRIDLRRISTFSRVQDSDQVNLEIP